jgi:hypothetical protein
MSGNLSSVVWAIVPLEKEGFLGVVEPRLLVVFVLFYTLMLLLMATVKNGCRSMVFLTTLCCLLSTVVAILSRFSNSTSFQ